MTRPDRTSPAPWWRRYDARTGPRRPRLFTPQDSPAYAVGDQVRLVARPERVRRILGVEWHHWRHTHVYTVETSTPPDLFAPYWFGDQLAPAAVLQSLDER